MSIIRKSILIAFFSATFFQPALAWGPEGHAIVGKLALHFMNKDAREGILKVLDGMPMDTAANWMDIMKSNSDYDFMRSWHYMDFEKAKTYTPSIDDNLINRLTLTFNELKHKNVLCDQQVQFDVLVLLHLMGDLHMPLHTGYEDDLGGNTRMVQYDTMKTHNLHRFWDEDIIGLNKITFEDCLALYNAEKDTAKTVDFVRWMYDSRSHLDEVYDIKDGYIITDNYLQKAKSIVTRQLLLGGLRLAAVMEKLFYASASPMIDFKAATKNARRGVDINESATHIGKEVTVCEHIYSIKEGPKTTQISLGAKYPNNPLTIIIFADSYANFPKSIGELYRDKNVCVSGTIEEYKGKPQIIIEKPGDIKIL